MKNWSTSTKWIVGIISVAGLTALSVYAYRKWGKPSTQSADKNKNERKILFV